MALEASIEANEAWATMKNVARNVRSRVPVFNAQLSSGGVSIDDVYEIGRYIQNAKTQLDDLATTPGLDAYVQTLPSKGSYVATTEVATVTSLMQNALDWLNTTSGTVNLSADTFDNWYATGFTTSNRFNAAATTDLRTVLSAIETAISAA